MLGLTKACIEFAVQVLLINDVEQQPLFTSPSGPSQAELGAAAEQSCKA